MADRPFTLQQTRTWSTGPEVVTLGVGVDHGDGTATVTPAEGLPGAGGPATVLLEELTEGHGHHGWSTSLIYQE
jgi:hypothetical protein